MRGVLPLLLLLTGILPLRAEESWLARLSPRLREVEKQKAEAQQSLEAAGKPVVGQTVQNFGFMHGTATTSGKEPRWVQVDLRESHAMEQIALVPVQIDSHPMEAPNFSFPKRFRLDVSDDPNFATFQTVADFSTEDFPDPGIAPVAFPVQGKKARYVRVTVQTPVSFTLAELMVIEANCNIANGCPVKSTGSILIGPRWTDENLVDGRTPLGPPILREQLPYDGVYAGPPAENNATVWMGLDLKEVLPIQEMRIHPVHARFNNDMPGYGFPVRFRVEMSTEADFSKPIVLLDASGADYSNPGNNPVTMAARGQKARYVRVVLIQATGFIHPQRFGLSEISVYSGGVNVARKAEVIGTGDPNLKTKDWPRSALNDGHTSFGRLIELPEWLDNWTRRRALEAEIERLQKEQATLVIQTTRRARWLGGGLVTLLVVGLGWAGYASRRRRQLDLETFRKRLAQDLHDEIGSNLAAIGVISETAANHPTQLGPEYWTKVNQIARETTDAMRETLWLAGGREETGIDLMEHLQLAASRMLTGRQVTWSSVVEAFPAAWPIEHRRQVFLFFKESLANIARHSGAESVELALRMKDGWLEVEVRDDGRGFSPGKSREGIGSYSLRERARRLGGTVEIESAPGKGTRLLLRVPVGK